MTSGQAGSASGRLTSAQRLMVMAAMATAMMMLIRVILIGQSDESATSGTAAQAQADPHYRIKRSWHACRASHRGGGWRDLLYVY